MTLEALHADVQRSPLRDAGRPAHSGVHPEAAALGFSWHNPVHLRWGRGAAEAMDQALGSRAAVVLTYGGAARHEAPARVRQALGARALEWFEVPDARQPGVGASTLDGWRAIAPEVWRVLQQAERSGPAPVLLALGGGAVMDLAKMLRDWPTDAHRSARLAQGPCARAAGGECPGGRAELWLVPTTAGTGSELTRWATLWDVPDAGAVDGVAAGALPPVRARKRSFDSPLGYADRAFVDPVFLASAPPVLLRDSALDALAHALEAIWNRHGNPMSDRLAVRAARRVLRSLPQALRASAEPTREAAREQLSLAATEAGLAFSQTRTALAHALSYELTLGHGVAHGLACALWLPTVCAFAVGRSTRVDARLAEVFDEPAAHGARRLRDWLRAVGVECDLRDFGIGDALAHAADALDTERGRNFVPERR